MVNAPAPIAPELAYKEDQHGKQRQKQLKIDQVGRPCSEDLR